MTLKPRLAIDMDEVIADAHGAVLARYESDFGYRLASAQCAGVTLRSLVAPEHAQAMDAILHEGSIYRSFAVIEGSQRALQRLMDRFEVFITSAAMDYPGGCAAKFDWLQAHFPFIAPANIVFCGDKGIIAADLMIDDHVRNFARFGGQGLLFAAPHNRDTVWPARVADWDDALAWLARWQPPTPAQRLA